MADNKKEQERDELHRAIWAIADELRGAVDGWDFKNYVLGTMFYRYISENICNYINEGEIEAGDSDFDYAQMSDEDDLLNPKAFSFFQASFSAISEIRQTQTMNGQRSISTRCLKRCSTTLKAPQRAVNRKAILQVCSMISM